ncbi:SMI1/KNR4 family protein [Paenibacillus campi]|uniref:SMI1/KNR4 family protein n=1 Tax=Paenibacillus campi TaxID=3106031 RepID=UPI002AFF57C1|nr:MULTISPECIES: SMI1/KNR4 family protein [unclassified Paenibacillus]
MINHQFAEHLWKAVQQHAITMNKCKLEQLCLRHGAKQDDFAELEKRLNVQVPDQLREWYRVHDGQDDRLETMPLLRNLTFSAIDKIIETWTFLQEEYDSDGAEAENESAIKPVLWNPAWIPIATNGSGDYVCVDTDPAEEGTYGQILYFWHDWNNRSVEAESLNAFIQLCLHEEQ